MFPPSTGPIEVTLTRPVDDIPRQCRTLEGQTQLAYELKIDGWRLILSKTPAGAVELWSRHGCNLTTAFPELAAAALEHLARAQLWTGRSVYSATASSTGIGCNAGSGRALWWLTRPEGRRRHMSLFDVLADAGATSLSPPVTSRFWHWSRYAGLA